MAAFLAELGAANRRRLAAIETPLTVDPEAVALLRPTFVRSAPKAPTLFEREREVRSRGHTEGLSFFVERAISAGLLTVERVDAWRAADAETWELVAAAELATNRAFAGEIGASELPIEDPILGAAIDTARGVVWIFGRPLGGERLGGTLFQADALFRWSTLRGTDPLTRRPFTDAERAIIRAVALRADPALPVVGGADEPVDYPALFTALAGFWQRPDLAFVYEGGDEERRALEALVAAHRRGAFDVGVLRAYNTGTSESVEVVVLTPDRGAAFNDDQDFKTALDARINRQRRDAARAAARLAGDAEGVRGFDLAAAAEGAAAGIERWQTGFVTAVGRPDDGDDERYIRAAGRGAQLVDGRWVAVWLGDGEYRLATAGVGDDDDDDDSEEWVDTDDGDDEWSDAIRKIRTYLRNADAEDLRIDRVGAELAAGTLFATRRVDASQMRNAAWTILPRGGVDPWPVDLQVIEVTSLFASAYVIDPQEVPSLSEAEAERAADFYFSEDRPDRLDVPGVGGTAVAQTLGLDGDGRYTLLFTAAELIGRSDGLLRLLQRGCLANWHEERELDAADDDFVAYRAEEARGIPLDLDANGCPREQPVKAIIDRTFSERTRYDLVDSEILVVVPAGVTLVSLGGNAYYVQNVGGPPVRAIVEGGGGERRPSLVTRTDATFFDPRRVPGLVAFPAAVFEAEARNHSAVLDTGFWGRSGRLALFGLVEGTQPNYVFRIKESEPQLRALTFREVEAAAVNR